MLNTVMLLQYRISPIKKKKEAQNRSAKVLWSRLLAYIQMHVVRSGERIPKVPHPHEAQREAKPNPIASKFV